MNVSLTPELERIVQEKIESGLYGNASEVLREGLRLLVYQDQERQYKLNQLKNEIEIGLAQEVKGQTVDGPKAFNRIRKNRQRLK